MLAYLAYYFCIFINTIPARSLDKNSDIAYYQLSVYSYKLQLLLNIK